MTSVSTVLMITFPLQVDSCSSNLVFASSWEKGENSEVEAEWLVQRSKCCFVTNMLAVYRLIFFYVVSNRIEHQCPTFHFAQKVLPAGWIFSENISEISFFTVDDAFFDQIQHFCIVLAHRWITKKLKWFYDIHVMRVKGLVLLSKFLDHISEFLVFDILLS